MRWHQEEAQGDFKGIVNSLFLKLVDKYLSIYSLYPVCILLWSLEYTHISLQKKLGESSQCP